MMEFDLSTSSPPPLLRSSDHSSHHSHTTASANFVAFPSSSSSAVGGAPAPSSSLGRRRSHSITYSSAAAAVAANAAGGPTLSGGANGSFRLGGGGGGSAVFGGGFSDDLTASMLQVTFDATTSVHTIDIDTSIVKCDAKSNTKTVLDAGFIGRLNGGLVRPLHGHGAAAAAVSTGAAVAPATTPAKVSSATAALVSPSSTAPAPQPYFDSSRRVKSRSGAVVPSFRVDSDGELLNRDPKGSVVDPLVEAGLNRREHVVDFYESLAQKDLQELRGIEPSELVEASARRRESIAARVTNPAVSASLLTADSEHSKRFHYLAGMTELQLMKEVNAARLREKDVYFRQFGGMGGGGGGGAHSPAAGAAAGASPSSSAGVTLLQPTPISHQTYPLSIENQRAFQGHIEYLAGPLRLQSPAVVEEEAQRRAEQRLKRYNGHISDAIKPASDVLSTFWRIFGVGAEHRVEFTDKVVRRHSVETYRSVAKEIRRYASRSDAYGTVMRLIALRETLLGALFECATNPLLVRDKHAAETQRRREMEAKLRRKNEATMKVFGGVVDGSRKGGGNSSGKGSPDGTASSSRMGYSKTNSAISSAFTSRPVTHRGAGGSRANTPLPTGRIGTSSPLDAGEGKPSGNNTDDTTTAALATMGGGGNRSMSASRNIYGGSGSTSSPIGAPARLRAKFRRVDVLQKCVQNTNTIAKEESERSASVAGGGAGGLPPRRGAGGPSGGGDKSGGGGGMSAKLAALRQQALNGGGDDDDFDDANGVNIDGTRKDTYVPMQPVGPTSEAELAKRNADNNNSAGIMGAMKGAAKGETFSDALNSLGGGGEAKPLTYSTHENLLMEALIIVTHLRHVTVLIVDMIEHERFKCRQLATAVSRKAAGGGSSVGVASVVQSGSRGSASSAFGGSGVGPRDGLPLGASKNDINALIEEDLLVRISIAKRKAINKNVFEAHYRGLSRRQRAAAEASGAIASAASSVQHNSASSIDAGVEKFDKLLEKLRKEQALEEKAERAANSVKAGAVGNGAGDEADPSLYGTTTARTPNRGGNNNQNGPNGGGASPPSPSQNRKRGTLSGKRTERPHQAGDIPLPLTWGGANYLIKMKNDLAGLDDTGLAELLAQVANPRGGNNVDACWTFKFAGNPFVLPTRKIPPAFNSPQVQGLHATNSSSVSGRRSMSAVATGRPSSSSVQQQQSFTPAAASPMIGGSVGLSGEAAGGGGVGVGGGIPSTITINMSGLTRAPFDFVDKYNGTNGSAIDRKRRRKAMRRAKRSGTVACGGVGGGTDGSSSDSSDSDDDAGGVFSVSDLMGHNSSNANGKQKRGGEAIDISLLSTEELRGVQSDPVALSQVVGSLLTSSKGKLALLPPLATRRASSTTSKARSSLGGGGGGGEEGCGDQHNDAHQQQQQYGVACEVLFQEDPALLAREREAKHHREHLRAKNRLTAHRTRLLEEKERRQIGLLKDNMRQGVLMGLSMSRGGGGGWGNSASLLNDSFATSTVGGHHASSPSSHLSNIPPFIPDEEDEPEVQAYKRQQHYYRHQQLLNEATSAIVRDIDENSRHVPFQKFFLTQILEKEDGAIGVTGGGGMRKLVGGNAGGGIGSIDALKRSVLSGGSGGSNSKKKLSLAEMMESRERELEAVALQEKAQLKEKQRLMLKAREEERKRQQLLHNLNSNSHHHDGSSSPFGGGSNGRNRSTSVVGFGDTANNTDDPFVAFSLNSNNSTATTPNVNASALVPFSGGSTMMMDGPNVSVISSTPVLPNHNVASSGPSSASAAFVPATHLQHYFDLAVKPVEDLTAHQSLNADGTHKNKYEYPVDIYFSRDRPVWERTAVLLARSLDVEFMRRVSDYHTAHKTLGFGGGGGGGRSSNGPAAGGSTMTAQQKRAASINSSKRRRSRLAAEENADKLKKKGSTNTNRNGSIALGDGDGVERAKIGLSEAKDGDDEPAGPLYEDEDDDDEGDEGGAAASPSALLGKKSRRGIGTKAIHPRQLVMNQTRYKFTIAEEVRSTIASDSHRMFPPSLLNPVEETVVDGLFHCFSISWPVQQYSESDLRARQAVIFNEVPIETNLKESAKAKFRRALYKIKMALSYFKQVRETKKGKRLHLAALDFKEWITVAAPSFAATVERDLVKWYAPLRDKEVVRDFN